MESSDEDIPLSPELSCAIDQLAKDGNLTAETFQQAIYKDMILARLLVKDLFRTPSNNTTRGWYTAVFRFFEGAPAGVAEDALAPMLGSPQFSY